MSNGQPVSFPPHEDQVQTLDIPLSQEVEPPRSYAQAPKRKRGDTLSLLDVHDSPPRQRLNTNQSVPEGLRPDQPTSAIEVQSRRSSFTSLEFPVPRLPQKPLERFRYIARAVRNWQKLSKVAFIKKPQDICSTCALLELTRDKFIIQDHSFDRNQQAYLSYPKKSSRSHHHFPLGSGSAKIRLGKYDDIRQRSQKCPFCHLVVCSLRKVDGSTVISDENRSAECEVSWQVDGRETSTNNDGEETTRARTRRIRLHWNNKSLPDSYLVLKAPESHYRHMDAKIPWDFESSFLGRSIKTAGHNTALVKSWLELCDEHHDGVCNFKHDEDDDKFQEMIASSYFGVIDVHEMRLTCLPPNGRYVALSYVWGDGYRYKSDIGNIAFHTKHGGLEKASLLFPRVITDSIKLVRSLGERFLWVDSLCIVQDSVSSWSLNSRVMNLVYGNAYFTICAADGNSAKDPLKAITPAERHIKQYMEDCAQDVTLMVSHLAETYIEQSKWNTRGWTFQERLLSKRCLIFAEERVFFQCRSTAMSEDVVSEKRTNGWSIELVQAPLQLLRELDFRAFKVYMTCVELYTKRYLTKPTDILAAFNGMSNLLAHAMGSSLVFGLPSSHFDLALLWQPTKALQRRAPLQKEELREFEGYSFPSWSWCGWMAHRKSKVASSNLFYNTDMLAGCLSNVHQWLMEHTWISWHIRDGHGSLRPIWKGNQSEQKRKKMEQRWLGYKVPSKSETVQFDGLGRRISDEAKDKPRTTFYRSLPEYPYRVQVVPESFHLAPESTIKDQIYLQFWTWSTFLKIYPNDHASHTLGSGLQRYDITDYTGDWCGTIVLDKEWGKEWGENPARGSEHEFVAISEAKNFTIEENEVWTYYIPKEREQSEWDLYYVLLVEHRGVTVRRVGLGKVFKEALANPCLPGTEWKEIILE